LEFLLHFGCLLAVIAAIVLYYTLKPGASERPDNVQEVRARVLNADNSEVSTSGFSSIGHQELEVELLEGRFRGLKTEAKNNLTGQTDLENLFKRDDIIIAAVVSKNDQVDTVIAIDLHRQPYLMILFGCFVAALLLYAGIIGIKALLSFVLTVFIIWEILVQNILGGYDPITVTTLTLMLLSAVIIFLVAGPSRRGMTAFLGTISGLFITLLVTLLFGDRVGLFGLTQPYVNVLVFSGHYDLDIRRILYSAIILGASGAAMDIAMDIAASMDEVRRKKPGISPAELIASGFTVGRQVIGTMATTLLLAYSGGYLTLLMVFRVKESSLMRMLNLKIVATEIMRTLIGSIGLALVAPITAVIGGLVITGLYGELFARLQFKAAGFRKGSRQPLK